MARGETRKSANLLSCSRFAGYRDDEDLVLLFVEAFRECCRSRRRRRRQVLGGLLLAIAGGGRCKPAVGSNSTWNLTEL